MLIIYDIYKNLKYFLLSRIKLLPALQKRISSEVLKSQLMMEKDRKIERERLFLMYTKQWWNEYLALRPTHSDRLVKIFTEVRGHVVQQTTCFLFKRGKNS